MKIREFIPNDLKRVVEIEKISFNQTYGENMFIKLFDIGAGFLVAEDNNYVVGYIIFWIKEEGIGHIISIAVDENYRRLKAGTELLKNAIILFKTCNMEKITLEVNENNKGAIDFYKKFDFRVDRIVPGYYENNQGAIVMYYDLVKAAKD